LATSVGAEVAQSQKEEIVKFANKVLHATFALAVMLVLGVGASRSAHGQTYKEKVLHSFIGIPDGEFPYASLVRDSSGNLYGTTFNGGRSGAGTVFRIDTAGKESVLHSFTGSRDGANPFAGLVQDAKGNLYGTTFYGGGNGCNGYGCGTVFKVSRTGKETVLHRFKGPVGDGTYPKAGLVLDVNGTLYGTTIAGGTGCKGYGCGTVFKLDPTGTETLLYSFAGGNDGANPTGLIRDAKGNLYGTTEYSAGTGCSFGDGCGMVFKLNKSGKETVLYRFTGTGGDGANPFAGLIQDANGNLYGTTYEGGTGCGDLGCGTVFKVSRTGKETVLYRFTGTGGDGATPYVQLVRDAKGSLYGTTAYGGSSSVGTVFKLDPAGKETVLYSFTGSPDGQNSFAGLVRDAKGNLYGTTYNGGSPQCMYFGCGTVFKLTP
jgi:uncharacterized repeat protein (TIGR03803 family)